MQRAGRGVLQVNSDFGPGEFEALEAAAALAGRPLSCLLVQVDAQPELWRETLDQIHGVRQAGRAANAQVGSRPIGVHHGPRDDGASVRRPSGLAARCASSRRPSATRAWSRDADLRRRLAAHAPERRRRAPSWREAFHKMFPIGDRPDYEPDAAGSDRRHRRADWAARRRKWRSTR